MKATLVYDLPEEQSAYACAVHGSDWKSVVWELDQKLRGYLKYDHEFKTADEAITAIRALLWQEVNDGHLDLWED